LLHRTIDDEDQAPQEYPGILQIIDQLEQITDKLLTR
jgi:hypothetical protein